MQTDRQKDNGYTDMTKLKVTFCNFVNVPKKWNTSHKCTHAHTHLCTAVFIYATCP